MTRFHAGSATDVGQIRSNNQDSKLVADEVSVFAVADGMGGHQGGEVASAIAVETLEAIITEPTTQSVVEAVKEANRRIFSRASDSVELRGMGTTLVAIALVDQGADDEEVAWVNVGDSRVYLLRDDELHQLSRDHSLVEDLRRGGQLSDEEAAVHPQRNILTRALGIDTEVAVDHGAVVPLLGDRFLLCSDGLFNEVDRVTLIATLATFEDPGDAASELVRLANAGGGRDNITCVVVDVVDDGGRAARAAEAAAAGAAAAAAGAAADGGEPVDGTGTTTDDATDDEADPAASIPTVEMPAVALDPPPDGDGATDDGATDDGATGDDTGTGAGTDQDRSPATDPGQAGPPAAPPRTATPVGAEDAAPEADGPGEQAEAARAGFPTDDDNDGAMPADDLPFGRGTKDVFEDIDRVKGRHRVSVALGALVVIGLLATGAYFGRSWWANSNYFLATEGEQVVVFRGRPGGFLGLEPTREAELDAAVRADDLPPSVQDAVSDERGFSSVSEARNFVLGEMLAAEDDVPDTTTTEPGSTTTTGATSTTTDATTTTGP